jgi:hypothetical protein
MSGSRLFWGSATHPALMKVTPRVRPLPSASAVSPLVSSIEAFLPLRVATLCRERGHRGSEPALWARLGGGLSVRLTRGIYVHGRGRGGLRTRSARRRERSWFDDRTWFWLHLAPLTEDRCGEMQILWTEDWKSWDTKVARPGQVSIASCTGRRREPGGFPAADPRRSCRDRSANRVGGRQIRSHFGRADVGSLSTATRGVR